MKSRAVLIAAIACFVLAAIVLAVGALIVSAYWRGAGGALAGLSFEQLIH